MKQRLSILSSTLQRGVRGGLLFLALVATTALWAEDFSVGGIYYNILTNKTNEVKVTYQGDDYYSYYDEYSGSITIPSTVTYNGTTYNVTSIGDFAFWECSSLTSVTIPNSVTSIGVEAFLWCSGLTSVTIGNSVTNIGDGAFSHCSSLTSITIPNSVTSIENYAFSGCSSLTSITIPNSVTSIGYGVFRDCSSLTSVTIGNSVTNIGDGAFADCSSLTSITIPESVTSIGEGAFYGTGIYNNESNWENGLLYISHCLIVAKDDISGAYIIKEDTRLIAELAFYECSGLTSITIPNSVTSIGYGVFEYCYSLTSVTAPAACFDISEDNWVNYTKSLTYVEVNAGELTADAFGFINRSYKTLKVLNLVAATNTTIADEAFKGCYNLDSLYLPSQLEYIPYMAVAECVNLKSITIPATVEEIDQRAFENCRSLKSVIFEGGETPKGAPHRAAAEGSSLWRIGSWAFYNCHQLEHLNIPEGVTEVGDAAFYGCTYLEDMTLPSTVQEIGDNGFALCAKLQKIHVKAATPPTIQAKTFFDVNRRIPVYVPDNAVEAYKDDPYWSEFDIQGESNTSSGVSDIQSPMTNCQKTIRNGQLIIIRDGVEYNAMGQEL